MLIHELSSDDCTGLLARTHLGRLACAKDGQPYVVPVHFSFDLERGCVYGFSTVGQKIRWMRENPLVCLEVEEVVDKDHWQTVVVFGRYEELRGQYDEEDARRRTQILFEERQQWWLPAMARLRSADPEAAVLYRVRIERMTGRRAARNVTATID